MRSRSRQGSRLTFHPIVIASAVVFVVLFLALGYHTGVKHEEDAFKPKLLDIKKALKKVDAKVKSCTRAVDDLTREITKSSSEAKALQQLVDGWEKEQREAQSSYKTLEGENGKCELDRIEVEKQRRTQDDQAVENRLEVEELTREVEALRVSVQQITHGDGMSIVLLTETVNALRATYTARCRALPGCVELSDSQLLALPIEENRTEEEIRKFLERDAAAQRDLANSLQGPSANLTGIYFLPTVAEERQWDAKSHYPSYFKRSITAKPLRGVKSTVSAVSAAGNVLTVLDVFGNYAMCAYRYNNPKFSFQSTFTYLPPSPAAGGGVGAAEQPVTARLHRLVVSPLLQYCEQCDAQMWTPEYRLACFKDRMLTPRNYGTRDFWAVRSMIQATPAIQKEALNFYESQNIEAQRVLAVVLHLASERDKEECDREAVKEYGIHYQYMTANFPNDTALQSHVAEDHHAQCSPTAAQIIERLEQVRAAAAAPATRAFDKIYLSVSADTRSNIDALINDMGLGELRALLLPPYANPKAEAATPGTTELVDLEIASRATDILVSPFLRASRYVTEQFLLRHRLNPGGHVWTF